MCQGKKGGRLNCIGPGKVGQALGLMRHHSGLKVGRELTVTSGTPPLHIKTAPRVGIEYASEKDRNAEWRFIAGSFPTAQLEPSTSP